MVVVFSCLWRVFRYLCLINFVCSCSGYDFRVLRYLARQSLVDCSLQENHFLRCTCDCSALLLGYTILDGKLMLYKSYVLYIFVSSLPVLRLLTFEHISSLFCRSIAQSNVLAFLLGPATVITSTFPSPLNFWILWFPAINKHMFFSYIAMLTFFLNSLNQASLWIVTEILFSKYFEYRTI